MYSFLSQSFSNKNLFLEMIFNLVVSPWLEIFSKGFWTVNGSLAEGWVFQASICCLTGVNLFSAGRWILERSRSDTHIFLLNASQQLKRLFNELVD